MGPARSGLAFTKFEARRFENPAINQGETMTETATFAARIPSYDPAVIQQNAERLLRQAASISISYAIRGLLLGGAVVGFAFLFVGKGHVGLPEIFIGAAIGLGVGFSIGREKGFQLRLQAQTALCYLQIEANTRSTLK
jgi:hypothetical protein